MTRNHRNNRPSSSSVRVASREEEVEVANTMIDFHYGRITQNGRANIPTAPPSNEYPEVEPTHVVEPEGTEQVANKRVKCTFCNSDFSHQSNRRRHVRERHMNMRPHRCGTCGDMFRRKGPAVRHMSTVYRQARPFRCEKCQTWFAQLDKLQEHMRAHES